MKDETPVIGIDGVIRSHAEEQELNAMFARVFRDADGQKALDYLRAITIQNVAGPEVSDGHLRHLEGQRFNTAIIQARVLHGRERKPSGRPIQQQRRGDRSA